MKRDELELQQRFLNAIEYMYEKNQYLASQLTRLGFPHYSKMVPTAGVMWDDGKKRTSFLFNKKFEQSLNDEEFYFVVAHEAWHILHCHVLLMKEEMEKMKRQSKPDAEIGKHIRKINIAADCVVNDSLTNLYGFEKIEKLGGGDVIYGKNLANTDCHDLTVREVMLLLKDKFDEMEEVENHLWESFFNQDGTLKEGFVKQLKNFVEDNLDNSSLSEKDYFEILN